MTVVMYNSQSLLLKQPQPIRLPIVLRSLIHAIYIYITLVSTGDAPTDLRCPSRDRHGVTLRADVVNDVIDQNSVGYTAVLINPPEGGDNCNPLMGTQGMTRPLTSVCTCYWTL